MYLNNKKLKVKRYASGELKLVKSILDDYVCNNRIEIIHENDFSVFELLLILKYYLNKGVVVDLILTYLPYQRMDHIDRDEVDTVRNVSCIFNSLKLNSLTVCEPHCDISMFNNSRSYSFVEKIKEIAFKEINFDYEEDVIVLTDKGGVEKYGYISKNIVYFNKVRDEKSGLIIRHDLVGKEKIKKRAIIIDDIISTGDTIVNIIEKLKEKGVKEIYVISGHMENNKYNKRIFENVNVIKVFSSNSLKKKGNRKLKLYNVKYLLNKIK